MCLRQAKSTFNVWLDDLHGETAVYMYFVDDVHDQSRSISSSPHKLLRISPEFLSPFGVSPEDPPVWSFLHFRSLTLIFSVLGCSPKQVFAEDRRS